MCWRGRGLGSSAAAVRGNDFSIISPCCAGGSDIQKGCYISPYMGFVTCMDEKLIWSKFSQHALRCLKSGHKFVIKSAAKRNENRLTNKNKMSNIILE